MNNIFLIGDSTCQTNDETTYPQVGWGQFFSKYLKAKYEVINLAKNGRSTKSFIDEGLFAPCQKAISKGDYLFIEFGHNDEKVDAVRHTDPYDEYQKNLLFFINTARSVGATPILLTSIYRRHFNNGVIEENCHGEYPQAMKELAKRENIKCIDMCEITKQKLIELGDEKSKELFMNFPANLYSNYPDGKNDNSHLREKGAITVCNLLTKELSKDSELKELLK